MTDNAAFRVADLPQNRPTQFDLRPQEAERKALAQDLELLGLRKLRFHGEIRASGKRDWNLKGALGATVVQPCVVTLDPVTTRLDVPVERLFSAEYESADEPESEMPEDDNTEPLESHIDPHQIMIEALALALPLYPRTEGAELGEAVFTKPGETAMRDEDARPFAGLSGLRDSLKGTDNDE